MRHSQHILATVTPWFVWRELYPRVKRNENYPPQKKKTIRKKWTGFINSSSSRHYFIIVTSSTWKSFFTLHSESKTKALSFVVLLFIIYFPFLIFFFFFFRSSHLLGHLIGTIFEKSCKRLGCLKLPWMTKGFSSFYAKGCCVHIDINDVEAVWSDTCRPNNENT